MIKDCLVVLDFGSQYAHLIAKRLRHLGFYTEIRSPATPVSMLTRARGLILSGGPASVNAIEAPVFNEKLLDLDVPILGLCYGHQLIAMHYGGVIANTGQGEFGKAYLQQISGSPLWEGLSFPVQVWMSHQDSVIEIPHDFCVIGGTESGSVTALQHRKRPLFSFQFHPEVRDTQDGVRMLENFAGLTGLQAEWDMESFVRESQDAICRQVGSKRVLMFLSGGVDSSVAFALLNRSLGSDRVLGLYMNNGFMRKNESVQIMERYRELGYTNIEARDFSREFLEALSGKVDPQDKRERVGSVFIHMREQFLGELELDHDDWLLGQGTLYPDIIESGGTEHANVIKSHHNRVEEVMKLIESGQVIEPLKDLYKDEVREVGALLGLPESIVWRHPFPGPGLSVNVICSDGKGFHGSHLGLKQKLRELVPDRCGAGVLPVRSVGVQGDQRTYHSPAVIWNAPKDWDWLEELSIQITNSVCGVNRVVTLLAPNELPDLRLREAYCTRERLDLLREADALVTMTLEEKGLMHSIFQLLVILIPLSENCRGDSLVIRPVCSEDVMTAQFAKLDWKLLEKLKHELLELSGIDAVFYDITLTPIYSNCQLLLFHSKESHPSHLCAVSS